MRKNNFFRRSLVAALSVVMVFGTMPNIITVQADETGETEINAPPLNRSGTESYDYIKDLIAADSSIEFDKETQTVIVIESSHEQTEVLQSLNISNAEELIARYELDYGVKINDKSLDKGQAYYVVSTDTKKIEKRTVTGWSDPRKVSLEADDGKVAVVIANIGDTYSVYSDLSDNYYGYSEFGYNGFFLCRPKSKQLHTEISGVADSECNVTAFSFEWDFGNWLDVEIYSADPITKTLDNPGFMNIGGYVDFKIELRDKDGNVTLLPKCFYNNYGSDNEYLYMENNGIVHIPFEPYDDDVWPHSTPYGEFDIYIPFGYDYRISLNDYSIDTLGGYAYVTNDEQEYDETGFCSPKHYVVCPDGESRGYGSFIEFTFMPCEKEIKIQKNVNGTAPENEEYTFSVKQNVHTFAENNTSYDYEKSNNFMQDLTSYPYDVYDSETGKKVKTDKTTSDGVLSLKSNQYAVLKVWELPEDFASYTSEAGFTFIDIYDSVTNIASNSIYSFEEIGDIDCATKALLNRNGTSTTINGKKVENVVGGDSIVFTNTYAVIFPVKYFPGTLQKVTNMPKNDTFVPDTPYTLSSSLPVRSGFEFIGWKTALEKEKLYRLSYNGQSAYTEYKSGEKIMLASIEDDMENGYLFSGYYAFEPVEPMNTAELSDFVKKGKWAEAERYFTMPDYNITLYPVYIVIVD